MELCNSVIYPTTTTTTSTSTSTSTTSTTTAPPTSTTTSTTTTTTTLAPGTGKLKNFGSILLPTYTVNQIQPFATTLASGSSLTPGGQVTFSAYFSSMTSLSVPITFNTAPYSVTGLLVAYPSGTTYTMGVSGSGTSRTLTFSGNLSSESSYQILAGGVDFEFYDIGGGYTEIYNYYTENINVYDGNFLIGNIGASSSDYFGFSTVIKLQLATSGSTYCFSIASPFNQIVCP